MIFDKYSDDLLSMSIDSMDALLKLYKLIIRYYLIRNLKTDVLISEFDLNYVQLIYYP